MGLESSASSVTEAVEITALKVIIIEEVIIAEFVSGVVGVKLGGVCLLRQEHHIHRQKRRVINP